MAVGDKVPLVVCCCNLTPARNIDLTAFNIKPGICWHIEMKSIRTMKSLIYRSNPMLAHSKGLSSLLYWNCILMMLARITDNRNFHYKGICYINEYWYRFLCSMFIVKSTAKKNHYKFNISLLPTLEVYLAFYWRYETSSPFHCPITLCSSHSA